VDEWLAGKAAQLSTDTLRRLLSILRRSIKRAQARDKVSRNVAMLCEVPKGTGGRPSKSLTLERAEALLEAAERSPMRAYIVDACLHRRVAADRCPDRGAAGADLESLGPGRQTQG
jgi:hypothetical protein